MSHFDRSKSLDHHLRVALLEAAEHVDIVGEPELGMQPADDVELARRIVARGVRFREYFVEAARVGAVFFRHPGERTEHAGVAQNADIRRIDVLVGGKVHAVAIAPRVGEVREVAEGEQVVRGKQREAVLACEPLAAFDLGSNGCEARLHGSHPKGHATFFTANVTLCPPNPNEFDSANSNCRLTALFGAESRSQAGSGVNWLIVGGMTPSRSASAQIASSNAPAAPSRWPVIDLVEPKINLRACSPNTVLTAAVSAASPCGVDVPCALM